MINSISGVYQIRNAINDKIYIGSAVNIQKRWREHISALKKNKHHSRYLQRSWNKYGEKNFEFVILEECEPVKETLLEREQFYLDTLSSEYNISPTAGSRLGAISSEETCKKISLAKMGQKTFLGCRHPYSGNPRENVYSENGTNYAC